MGVNAELWGPGVLAIYNLVPMIADMISAHCPGTSARDRFLQACLGDDWDEVRAMTEGMLAEPWHLRSRQEIRLREFLNLVLFAQAVARRSRSPVG
jgi:hypothetical protein